MKRRPWQRQDNRSSRYLALRRFYTKTKLKTAGGWGGGAKMARYRTRKTSDLPTYDIIVFWEPWPEKWMLPFSILLNFVPKRDNPSKQYPQPFQTINQLIDEKGRDGRKGSEMKEGRPHSSKVARLFIQCYQWRNSFVFSFFYY